MKPVFAKAEKRIRAVMLTVLMTLMGFLPEGGSAANREPKALTLMIYMCGSNLESEYGSASADILEMLSSGVDTDRVNILILTGGSQVWQIVPTKADTGVSLLFRGQLMSLHMEEDRSMGDPTTLTELLRLGLEQYPAERYALVLWDHGAGPLEGVCLDELNAPDRLDIRELIQALSDADLPDPLSWIGFDACLMASAEVAQALSPYARYMIASQETEPSAGWDYAFLKDIEQDEDGAATGQRIVDSYFGGANGNAAGLTLCCVDLSRMDKLTQEMDRFFSPIGSMMNEKRFADLSELRMNSASFGKAVRGITSDGYDLVDLGDLVSRYAKDANGEKVLRALADAVVYTRSSDGGASGLSVYHPYRNKTGYLERWKEEYSALSFSPGYQRYLNAFGTLLTGESLADWSGLRLNLTEDVPRSCLSLRLSEEQISNAASAQLIVLATVQQNFYSEYAAQLSENGFPAQGESLYYPVYAADIPLSGDLLSADYGGRGLYMLDAEENIAAGPISYTVSDDGSRFYVRADFMDDSGREHPKPNTMVLFTCEADGDTGNVRILQTEVYDRATETYTQRIAFDEKDFTRMAVLNPMRYLPAEEDGMPGFAAWESAGGVHQSFAIPRGWTLRFMEEQLSGLPLYATVQITDVQQNTHCAPLVRVQNPNLHPVTLSQQAFRGDTFEMSLYAVLDTSDLEPGLLIGAEIRNTTEEEISVDASALRVNGHRIIDYQNGMYMDISRLKPGETQYKISHLDPACLAGLGELTDLSFTVQTKFRNASLSDGNESVSCACSVSGCAVSCFDALLAPTLAETTGNGLTWRLVSLEKNRAGGMTGLLHITNPTGWEVYRYGGFTVNDRLQTADNLGYTALPHSDACIPFTLTNRVDSAYKLHVTDVDSRVYLGLDHLMERSGIGQIESLGLTRRTEEDDPLRFALDSPLSFASEEELALYAGESAGEPRTLLEGEVTVEAERLLVADDGIGLTLFFRNQTDHDIFLEIGHKTVEGRDSTYQVGDWIFAGAGKSGFACIEIMLEDGLAQEIGSISEIGLCFRKDDYTAPPAFIRLKAPVLCGQSGGVYADRADFETVSAPAGPLKLTAEPKDTAFSGGQLTLGEEIRFGNVDIFDDYGATEAGTRVYLPLRLTNTARVPMHFGFSDFQLNGSEPEKYMGMDIPKDLPPGESAEGTLSIYVTDLLSAGFPASLTFTAAARPASGSSRSEYATVCLTLTAEPTAWP